VFAWEGDWEEPLDPAGHGNLETRLEPASATPPIALDPDHPEARLEARIRRAPHLIDAELRPTPIYGQVPAWAARDRDVIDLLAVGQDGRLAVVELKASADIHLPLQALDYWLRVEWHQRQGDFSRAGYFPGIGLSSAPPRLLLVAPALQFHPSTETILRHFSSRIEVERIGLFDTRFAASGSRDSAQPFVVPAPGTKVEWQGELGVAFRIRGAGAAS
jgi:hypothetical protein